MLDLATPWLSAQPIDRAACRKRLYGGDYSNGQVDEYIDAIARHTAAVGFAAAPLVGQTCHETANFRYGGQVDASQFNFGGIGAVNDGRAGASFASIDDGVRAMIAHHANYLFGPFDRWPVAFVPYQDIAIRNAQVIAAGYGGVVDVIGDYTNGRWAYSGNIPVGSLANGYAEAIVRIGNTLLGAATPSGVPQPPIDRSVRSPNRDGYKDAHDARCVVWHITAGTNSLGWLCNPTSGASCNYLIRRDGHIYELVEPTVSAWANGRMCDVDRSIPVIDQALREGRNLNTVSISIEHEGFTSYGRGGSLTSAQSDASVALTAWLCDSFDIAVTAETVIGYYCIDACDRPDCPGFSDAEWSAWLDRVAAIVNDGGSGVKEPEPGNAAVYINERGETIVVANFGGVAVTADGADWIDVGATVINDGGEKWSRSIQANVMQDWINHGVPPHG